MGNDYINPMFTPPSTIPIHPRGAAEKEGFKHFDALDALQKKRKAGSRDDPSTKTKPKSSVKKPAKK